MDNSDRHRFSKATKWEAAVSDLLETVEERNISFTWFSKTSYAIETRKITKRISLSVIISLVAMIFLVFVVNMSRQWTQSKPWMSIAFVLCVILAMASGLGLGMYCGIKFATIVIFDLFLLIGIGMNDTFTLIASWRRTDRKDSVENRLAQTYSEVFVPITLTFLIIFVCFCIGLAIPFRAAQIFCAYSALTSVFLYLYEITFLSGCLAIGGYREAKNLHPVTCLSVSMRPSNAKLRSSQIGICRSVENSAKPEVNYLLSRVFGHSYIAGVTHVLSRIVIFLLFLAYIIVASLQCTKLQVTSGVTDIFAKSNHLVSYYERHYKYFTMYPHRIQLIIDTPMDYSDPEVQQKVENLLQSFENSSYVEKKLTGCWLRVYKEFREQRAWMVRGLDFLEGLYISFFRLPMTIDLATDVIFNATETGVLAMRCAVHSYNINSAGKEKDLLDELERIASQSELPVTFTSMLFPSYDIHRIIRQIVILIIPITAGVASTAFVLLVPSVVGALVGTLATVSIEVGVVGFLALWNVKVNTFFAMMIVMIIGLSVNYVCHLTYAYATSTEETAKDRLFYALKYRGTAIAQTTLILIISCALLLIVGNLLLEIFYKILFLVFVFGAVHALFFLPVFLFTIDKARRYSRRFLPDTHELGKVQNSDYTERIGTKGGTDI